MKIEIIKILDLRGMEKKDLRIVFMGTPEFAVETLKALVENGYNVVAVVTQPDKPVGRHQNEVQPSEVKKYALEHQLPVLQPEKMKSFRARNSNANRSRRIRSGARRAAFPRARGRSRCPCGQAGRRFRARTAAERPDE